MPTVKVTYVQATYVLVTFVNISNISADTDSILTKLFGAKFLGTVIFLDQTFLNQILFCTKNFLDQLALVFLSQIFFLPKIFTKLSQGHLQLIWLALASLNFT